MNIKPWPDQPERRDLGFMRAYYFTFFGGWGFVLPFANLFYTSLGLSGKHIGVIAATSALVSLIVSPLLVNAIKHRPTSRPYMQLILGLAALGYLFIARQTEFLPIVTIVFFQTFAISGIVPLSDALAVAVAQAAGKGYGSVRVWASVGWIITVLTAGRLIEAFGYPAGYAGTSLAFAAGAVLLYFLQPRHFTGQPQASQAISGLRMAARRVWNDRTLLGFAIAVVCIGFLNNGVLQFEYVFLSQLGATKSLISVAGILSAIVEMPFMILSDRLMRRFGAHRMILAALSMILLQRAAVLLFPSIAAIMIVRLLGGTSFSFYTVAFVGLISSRTTSEETGTVLALFTVTLSGLVSVIASPVAGLLFDTFGGRWLYAFAMAGYAIGVLSVWITRPDGIRPGVRAEAA
jgi:PPP family 3-phenylpropionic acid transporter